MMYHQKRRKKRLSHGVKTVEITRGKYGYGFTISGQQPCVLSCIVTGSPAEQVGLKPGDFLLGVNHEDVSRAPHDDVVRLIGTSFGLLVLQIAENVNSSDSSDEEYHLNKPKSKYPNRHRQRQNDRQEKNTANTNSNTNSNNRAERVLADLQSGAIFHEPPSSSQGKRRTNGADRSKTKSPAAAALTTEPPPNFGVNRFFDENNDGANSRRTKSAQSRPRVTSPLQDNTNREVPKTSLSQKSHVQQHAVVSNGQGRVNVKYEGQSGLPVYRDPPPYRGSSPYEVVLTPKDLSNILAPTLPLYINKENVGNSARDVADESVSLRVIVGYIGSIEIPTNFSKPNSHVQMIKNAIRRLRVEQKIHTLVLMEVFSESVKLKNASGTVIATYPSEKVAYSGVCPDDKRFFGIVTVTSVSSDEISSDNGSDHFDHVQSSSCHVFMVDPELRTHSAHAQKARSFRIDCTVDPETQGCLEFPRSSTPILRVLSKLYKDRVGSWYDDAAQPHILANPNVDHQRSNSNSSNSDSGLGLPRDEGSANDRVFIVDLDASRNAAPMRPGSHLRQVSLPHDAPSNISNENSRQHRQSSNHTDLPPTGRSSDRLSKHFDRAGAHSQDDLESVSSADSIRRSMHKLLQNRQRNYVGDSSDAESVRSESSHPQTSRRAKLLDRPMSVPLATHTADQTIVKHSRPANLNCSLYAVETIDLADKLSPRAFGQVTPKIRKPVTSPGGIIRNIGDQFAGGSPSAFKKPAPPTAFKPWSRSDATGKTRLGNISFSHESLVPSEHDHHERHNTSCLAPASSLDSVADLNKSMKEHVEVPVTISASWAVNLDKLLNDGLGLAALMEFLKKEFSQENLLFWITCEKFKRIQDKEKQKARAKEIFDKHIASRAPEPVNIDSQARKTVEQGLTNVTSEMFKMAQTQIYHLMKTDCYPRFLKSTLYKQYVIMEMGSKPLPLQPIEIDEAPAQQTTRFWGTLEKKKSKKNKLDEGQEEKRKKSFLPWHKNKSRKLTKEDSGKKAAKPSKLESGLDTSFAKKSLKMQTSSSSLQKEGERSKSTTPTVSEKSNVSRERETTTIEGLESSSIKVVLPDGTTSTLSPSKGQTVKSLVSKLCEKKGLSVVSIDVYPLGSDKALDIHADISTVSAKEMVIERRVLFRMDLPNKKCIGIKAKPKRSVANVVRPVLHKYGYKLDNVVMHMANSPAMVTMEAEVSTLEHQRVVIQSREDFAEWGGFDGSASNSKPPIPKRTSASKNDLDEITTKVFDDIFSKVNNGPHRFDELGILDPDRKDDDNPRTSEGRNSSGLFGLLQRNSFEKDKSKSRGRPSLGGTQKSLPSKLAKMRIQDKDNDKLFELLSRAQSQRLDDQRGLSSDRFELPDFLKTDQPTNKMRKGNFKTTSSSDMFGTASKGVDGYGGMSLFRSQSHPEGLESDVDDKPFGHDLQIRSITPGPGDISFFDDSFSQDCVLPSHTDAENMFSGGGQVTSTPDIDFDNPHLMKKSVRDLGFNYSVVEDNQHCYVRTQPSSASKDLGITPIRARTPLDKKLSPRATLPASAFNEQSLDNKTCFDESDSLNLTVIGGDSVADASLISEMPPAPELLEMSTISHVAEANFPPPTPLKPPGRISSANGNSRSNASVGSLGNASVGSLGNASVSSRGNGSVSSRGNGSGSSLDSTFTGSNSSQKSLPYTTCMYSVPEYKNDSRHSPHSRQYPPADISNFRSHSTNNSVYVPSQSRRSTPTMSMNETTMTLSPMEAKLNSSVPVPSSKQMSPKRIPPPVPEKPSAASRKNMALKLNSPSKVRIELSSPSPTELPSPSTHEFVLSSQLDGGAADFKEKMRRVCFENPEVRPDAKVTFV
ncbi:regulator of G-protein signaling 12-like isoform X2 [Lineus longissimus]|uniref:regulator of G-protein signaling 12-like isoform X2 n=1 Tax=Lineus longissimus TaxID=88925 RepID=UPI00315D7089